MYRTCTAMYAYMYMHVAYRCPKAALAMLINQCILKVNASSMVQYELCPSCWARAAAIRWKMSLSSFVISCADSTRSWIYWWAAPERSIERQSDSQTIEPLLRMYTTIVSTYMLIRVGTTTLGQPLSYTSTLLLYSTTLLLVLVLSPYCTGHTGVCIYDRIHYESIPD